MPEIIYPKDIAQQNLRLKRNTCFVLMPFGHEFDSVYARMKEALGEVRFQCTRADDIYRPGAIMRTVVSEILVSHFVIADLSDRSPNVFYELGIANALKDQWGVILLAQRPEEVPFDLRHLHLIQYDRNDLASLAERLKKAIEEYSTPTEGKERLHEKYESKLDLDEIKQLVHFFGERPHFWETLLAAWDHKELASPRVMACYEDFKRDLCDIQNQIDQRLFDGLVVVYFDFLVWFARFPENDGVRQTVTEFLKGSTLDGLSLELDRTEQARIDLAICAFNVPEFKRLSFQCMLSHLAQRKVSGVTLIRNEVESLVFQRRNDEQVRQWLIESLHSDSPYLREEMADLLGEIAAGEALDGLVATLSREQNVFVARSIFTALGKIRKEAGAIAIMDWLRSQPLRVIEANSFLLNHAANALKEIDARGGSSHLEHLDAFLSANSLKVDPTFW